MWSFQHGKCGVWVNWHFKPSETTWSAVIKYSNYIDFYTTTLGHELIDANLLYADFDGSPRDFKPTG